MSATEQKGKMNIHINKTPRVAYQDLFSLGFPYLNQVTKKILSMSCDESTDRLNSYVKLNVGGGLFYTTIGTLLRGHTMLNAMFSGRMEVKTDDDGWVLIDRSGKHFGTVLNCIRDGSAPLPSNRRELEELLAEARYFCVESLRQACEDALCRMTHDDYTQNQALIIIVKCPNAAKALVSSTRKPVVKLTMNRYNNVFSYTSNSHDNLLRNIECLEKYALMFPDSVLFVKDVRDKSEQNEICEWSYYCRGHRLKSIDCIAIHYSSEKRLIKVEFPESRIHEEMLSLLSVSTRGLGDAELRELAVRKANCVGSAVGTGPTNPLTGGGHSPNLPAMLVGTTLHDTLDETEDQASTASLANSLQSHSLGPPMRPVFLAMPGNAGDSMGSNTASVGSTLTSVNGNNGNNSTNTSSATVSRVRLGRR